MALAIEKFETIPQLGRFTLRDEGRTIAAGKILKYKPHKVESSIQVVGGSANPSQTVDETKKLGEVKIADKNEPLFFDGEAGEVVKPKAALNAITEDEEEKE